MTRLDALREDVLGRLRALALAHPERTVHLTIDVARHGAPLPVPTVHATLEDLMDRGQVVHVGGGWRPADGPEPVRLEVSAPGDGAVAAGRAAPADTVWVVLISGGTVHSVHATEHGARARVAELDSFDAHVERRPLEG